MVPLIFVIPGLTGEDGLIRKNTVRFKRAAGCAFLGIPPQGPLFFILLVSYSRLCHFIGAAGSELLFGLCQVYGLRLQSGPA